MKLWAILPELVLAGACLVLVPVAGWATGRARVVPLWGAGAAIAAALALTARMLLWEPVSVFDGTYAVDGFATVFKLVVLAGALLALLAFGPYFRGRPAAPHAPVALLFSTLGAVLVTGASDLALLILFLQMMSMSGYVLTAMRRTSGRALEAGLKMFLYGALALAVMAYGLTFLYGLTGSLDLRVIGERLPAADPVWASIAFVLILAGLGFEITMVPFHVWAPDVYDGTTAPAAGFLSVVPKVAGIAALLRLLQYAYPGGISAWPWVLAGGAVLTMTFGNLLALRQENLKRLLAWSTVAQAGYVIVAVVASARTDSGVSAAAYYLAAYAFMNLGAFAAVAHVESSLGTDAITAIRGLGRRSPAVAAVLALCLLSLAGIPPLAGFAGKVLVLRSALEGGWAWLAVVAAANMALGLFYYVRVTGEMFLRAPEEDHTLVLRLFAPAYALALTGLLVLGILPGPAVAAAGQAALWLQAAPSMGPTVQPVPRRRPATRVSPARNPCWTRSMTRGRGRAAQSGQAGWKSVRRRSSMESDEPSEHAPETREATPLMPPGERPTHDTLGLTPSGRGRRERC